MDARASFDSTKRYLVDLMKEIEQGSIQLPDFQRSWVWDDDHVKSLLASISLFYPIGAIMLLEAGNPDVKFKPRPIEGVNLGGNREPAQLILDGQQRLTALYLAICSRQPVHTRDSRGNSIDRWYYFDMRKAIDPEVDREEAILSVPADRKIRDFRAEVVADYSTREREYEQLVFPVSEVFDYFDWMEGFDSCWDYDKDRMKLFRTFAREVLENFKLYQVPVIVLGQATPKEAVCQVFEKVNTAGVALTVFELLTATFAAEEYNLREDWEARLRRLRTKRVLHTIDSTHFLQAVTLLSTRAQRLRDLQAGKEPERARGISCKRKDVLRLSLQEYKAWADVAEKGLLRAARLLHSQCIFDERDIPYASQLVPLSAILGLLGERADNAGVREKLLRWFWCGVFGELYGGTTETRFARDLPEVLEWIDGGPEPSTVAEANFSPGRLLTLRTRNSAAYKGLYALLMRDGAVDLRTGERIIDATYFDEKIDIHHIFPQEWCRSHGIEPARCDSIVNKTALSGATNRSIGGRAPSEYLQRLQNATQRSEEQMDAVLATHLIDPSALRKDDFDSFFASRQARLLSRIAEAMGKPVLQAEAQEPDVVPTEYEEEDAA